MIESTTLMRFAMCERCHRRERLFDDADGPPRLCDGCGGIGTYRFIGVTDPAIAEALFVEFPEPTHNGIIPQSRI